MAGNKWYSDNRRGKLITLRNAVYYKFSVKLQATGVLERLDGGRESGVHPGK
jgi:hypothetical protein